LVRRPPRTGKGPRGPAYIQRDQPIAAIRRRPEHGICRTEGAKRREDIRRAGVRDVAPDNRNPAAAKAGAGVVHALADITAPLVDPRHAHWQRETRATWGGRQDGAETALRRKGAQQAYQVSAVEPQRGARANIRGQALLHSAQARRTGKDDHRIGHRP